MTVTTTIERELPFGVPAKITYRANEHNIIRETCVEVTDHIPGYENWQTASKAQVATADVPKEAREELMRKTNEAQDDAVSKYTEIRKTLGAIE